MPRFGKKHAVVYPPLPLREQTKKDAAAAAVAAEQQQQQQRPTRHMRAAAALRNFDDAKKGRRKKPRELSGKRRFTAALVESQSNSKCHTPACLVVFVAFFACSLAIGLALTSLASDAQSRHASGVETTLANFTQA